MSSFLRRMQVSPGYQGRGTKLGVSNPKDASLLARLKREQKRAERRNQA